MRTLSGQLPDPIIENIEYKGIQCTLIEIELDNKTIKTLDSKKLCDDIQFYDAFTSDVNIHFNVKASNIPNVLVDAIDKLSSYDVKVIVSHNNKTSADVPTTVRTDLVAVIKEAAPTSGWLWNPIIKEWCNPKND